MQATLQVCLLCDSIGHNMLSDNGPVLAGLHEVRRRPYVIVARNVLMYIVI
jgi:hypothetical protein